MGDRKIIIIAIVLAVLFVGYGWYYQKTNPSPVDSDNEPLPQEQGIVIGRQDAPVLVELYTNFLCPACANFAANTMPAIQEQYIKTSQIKMVVYVLPPVELSMAALCADEQQKFLQFHDTLFESQAEIKSIEALKNIAEGAGLDKETFGQCLDSEKHNEAAMAWYKYALGRGVEATPTLYINDQKLEGAYPFEFFREIIEEKLNK